MKCKHYYYFGEEIQSKMIKRNLDSNNWDLLRNDNSKSPFVIEKSIKDYINNCNRQQKYIEAADITNKFIRSNKIESIVSLGVGKGILEYHIKTRNPNLRLLLTDYASESINSLKKVFPENNTFGMFDILNGDYNELNEFQCVLLYRVSTEFDYKQWKNIFNNMFLAGIKHIIFIPTELLTIKLFISEVKKHINCLTHKKKDIFCGWMFSENEFNNMFSGDNMKPMYIVNNVEYFGETAFYDLMINQ